MNILIERRPLISKIQFILNGLILLVWLWLFRPIYPYLTTIFTRQDFRTNQIVLALLVAIFIYKAREEGLHIDFNHKPQPHRLPLLLLFSATSAFIFFERYLDINNLSAALLVIATYGLAGLYLQPRTWRSGLPIMLLLAGTLPVNHHLQTFVGYPMRLVTASIVRDMFASAAGGSLAVSTILVFENGIAHVDIPCSGVQSLWTGAMFLLLASWLERKKLGWRWLVTAVILSIALFLSNLVRIAALVWTGQIMGWTPLAEMLHVPLGVLGFVLACMLALALLRHWVPAHAGANTNGTAINRPTAPLIHQKISFPILLIGVFLLLSALHKPYVRANELVVSMGWSFPAALQTEAQPLDSFQLEWLLNDGADSADRYRFQHGDLSGSMLFVVADNWHAHHFPEGCFAGSGLKVHASQTELISAEFPIRWLTLTAADGSQYSAAFWFQSAENLTDDYATRIWDDLRFERNEWVLVSALFDQAVAVDSAETITYLNDLRTAAQLTLDH